ncbi:MAG: hypothetical protein JWO42_2417, partial [Chloroflexi bacterium]|nr:hypothetical protein [Chloroflexota bacterium]
AVDVESLKERLLAGLENVESSADLGTLLATTTAEMANSEWPFFAGVAAGYGIPAEQVHSKEQFSSAIRRAMTTPGPYLIQVMLPALNGVYPLMEPWTTPQEMIWREVTAGSGCKVAAHERFDYVQGRLRSPADVRDTHAEPAGDTHDLAAL